MEPGAAGRAAAPRRRGLPALRAGLSGVCPAGSWAPARASCRPSTSWCWPPRTSSERSWRADG